MLSRPAQLAERLKGIARTALDGVSRGACCAARGRAPASNCHSWSIRGHPARPIPESHLSSGPRATTTVQRNAGNVIAFSVLKGLQHAHARATQR